MYGSLLYEEDADSSVVAVEEAVVDDAVIHSDDNAAVGLLVCINRFAVLMS